MLTNVFIWYTSGIPYAIFFNKLFNYESNVTKEHETTGNLANESQKKYARKSLKVQVNSRKKKSQIFAV